MNNHGLKEKNTSDINEAFFGQRAKEEISMAVGSMVVAKDKIKEEETYHTY